MVVPAAVVAADGAPAVAGGANYDPPQAAYF